MPRLSSAPIGSWFHSAQRQWHEAKAPAQNTPGAWERHLDEVFTRGIAHLRDVGIEFKAYPDKRVAQLTGGEHPFNQLIQALGAQGIAVCFMPGHTEGKFAAGVIHRPNGAPVLLLGTRVLLELDPNTPTIVHERIHLEGEKRVGVSPHGARYLARDSRLPGPVHWPYSGFQAADEPQAHLAGIIKGLSLAATALRDGDRAKAREPFEEARRDIVGGLETSLRNVATAKQAIGALQRGALTQLTGGTLDPGEVGFGLTRRDGSGYEVRFRNGGLESELASDAALARPGEVGPATRARLLAHFAWQLRAGREELAIFRVLGQATALLAAMPEPDPRIIDAAIAVATQERAAVNAAADPVSYEEALRVFNEHAPG